MATLYHETADWGQFDDAPEDETSFGDVVDEAIDITSGNLPEVVFRDPGRLQNQTLQKDANRRQTGNANQQHRNQDAVHRSALSVRFAQDVSDGEQAISPSHVLLTCAHSAQFPSMQLRGSSSRVNDDGKASPVKASCGRTVKTKRSCLKELAPSITKRLQPTMSARALGRVSTNVKGTIPNGHNGQSAFKRLPITNSSPTKSQSLRKAKVAASAVRAREVETAEVLRSLRQTNKDDNVDCELPRPGFSDALRAAPPPRLASLKSSSQQVFRRVSMPPLTSRNDHPTRGVVADLRKQGLSQEQLPGDSKTTSPSLKAAPRVTPPLNSVGVIWDGQVFDDADLFLGPRTGFDLREENGQNQTEYHFDGPVRLRVAKGGVCPPVVFSQRNMRQPWLNIPRSQAAVAASSAAHGAKRPSRQQPVVCVLPPYLLPPPVLPSMRSKTAIEGFVAPLNVPTVGEDKERKNPIPNSGLRKRDVLFFAPLVHCKIRHYGTLQYCFLCYKHQDLYSKCNPTEKRELLNNLVRYVRGHGGRFLEWDEERKSWFDIGDGRAAQRTMLGVSGGSVTGS